MFLGVQKKYISSKNSLKSYFLAVKIVILKIISGYFTNHFTFGL